MKKNASLAALCIVLGLSAMAFLPRFGPLASVSQATQEPAMTTQTRPQTEFSSNLKPVDPAHDIALFALG